MFLPTKVMESCFFRRGGRLTASVTIFSPALFQRAQLLAKLRDQVIGCMQPVRLLAEAFVIRSSDVVFMRW